MAQLYSARCFDFWKAGQRQAPVHAQAFVAAHARRQGRGAVMCGVTAGNQRSRSLPPADSAKAVTAVASNDPFVTAGLRLQRLLADLAWDGGEELRQGLLQMPVPLRMTFFTNVCSFMLGVAMIVIGVTDEDPFGGIFSSHSGTFDALLGVSYALPLLATSLISRGQRMHHAFPVLEALHDSQEKVVEPMVRDLDVPQVLIVTAITTLASVMLMLPAMHGSMLVLGDVLRDRVLYPAGVNVPTTLAHSCAAAVPAISSSCFAAIMVARQFSVKAHQYEAIRSAMANSDRYFKLTESIASPGGDTSSQSQSVSSAFKTVSFVWLVMQNKVCKLSCALTALNVCYISLVWHETGDLCTPLACAMLGVGGELFLCRRSLAAKELARGKVKAGQL